MSFNPPSSLFSPQKDESGKYSRQQLIQIPGYEIEHEIGRGGMAVVYLAIQKSLNRRVALKVLTLESSADNDFAQRFKKEGHILAQLIHPNIVTIYDIGATENYCFFSMEYLPGDTLKQKIKQSLSLEYTIKIARAIAKALGYAHEKGLVHRDVKPPNILFRDDGAPVLTDFGVARAFESKTINTMAGLTVGSPGYMSPEQARGEIATIQSDLYSFGVVIYEMLTGRPLYEADNVIAVTLKHLHDPIPKLPKEYAYFQPVLNRLLAKKSSDRYPNIGAFLTALDTLVPSNDTESLPKAHTDIGNLSIAEFTSGKLRALLHTNRKAPLFALGIFVATAITVGIFNLKTKNPTTNTTVSGETQSATQSEQMQREQKITILLKQAEMQLHAKALSGAENSAESIYRHILKLEPGNIQALIGLQNIAAEYAQQARQQLNKGLLQESLNNINKGLAITPTHEGLMRLRQNVEHRIADAKTQKTRQEDQEQRQLQAEQFFIQAQSSFQEGALEVTLAHIEQGLLAIPDHQGLLALREQTKARLIERQRNIEAQRRQQEETARRQAEIAELQKAEQARQQAETARRLRQAEQYLAEASKDQKNNQYAEGLQQIEKGLALVPDHAQLTRLREEMRTQLASEQKRLAKQAQREQEITALLKQADAQWKAKSSIEPVGNNAEMMYRQVLKLDPNNASAQEGLERIAQEYERQAQQRRKAGALQESLAQIDKGLEVTPGHERLISLRQEVEREIATVKAQQDREEEQRSQADRFFSQAQSNFQQGALEASLNQIEQGLAVLSSHSGLLTLRNQVKTQIAEQERQRIETQRRQEEEKRRQVEEAERQNAEQARQEETAQRRQEETLWQVEEAERRKVEKARQQAETARRLQEADRYLARALDDQQNGRYAEGLQQIEKGLTLVPNHAELLRLRETTRVQLVLEQQKQEQQHKEQQRFEKQRLEQQQLKQQRQEEKQRAQQKRFEQQQGQQRSEQQRQEQQRQEEKQRQEQQRQEQQLQEQRRLKQQKEQQRLEQQRKEQQPLEQQRQEQRRKLEQQRQENLPQEQHQPETTTKPRVFGTF